MNLIEEAYQRLFPNHSFSYLTTVRYSRQLGDFNSTIRRQGNIITVHLNVLWKYVDEEIVLGLIQHLLGKIFREKRSTPNMELYHNFVKNIPSFTPKTKNDPLLLDSFVRVNEQYFSGLLERPNLEWGSPSRRKLAHYNFHTDTITVSTLFQEARAEVLDYLMYHELLHKHHQFQHRNGRSSFHSHAFKIDEKRYEHYQEMEREITAITQQKRRTLPTEKKRFWGLFA